MISVQQAADAVLSNLHQPRIVDCSIENAVGRILAEPLLADRDFPPFDRVTMDGIAIAFDAFNSGSRSFHIERTQAAGEPTSLLSNPAHCIEVMTGAILPTGSDTVVRYEDLSMSANVATIRNNDIQRGQSIHKQGLDARKGNELLQTGMLLSAAEIALLASVGKSTVKVFEFPKAAIIGSGDELVPIDDAPLPHQIRRSNTYALQAAMHKIGWHAAQYHLRDDKASLTENLSKLLHSYDVLILSGGVSKGKYDFIPEVLDSLGVQKIFHEVNQRPGKPFLFGVKEKNKHVFALPGNPVSTFMCFYRYIKPWLLKSLQCESKPATAMLAKDFSFKPQLTYFLQVAVSTEGGKLLAYPDQGGGSGDFANLKKIDGFLELPPEKTEFKAGEVFPFIPFRQ